MPQSRSVRHRALLLARKAASPRVKEVARRAAGKRLVDFERRGLRPQLSVVVPVYNVAEYLPAALDSALTQSLGDLEVIAVDDGSTDDCLRILRDYERRDPRVKVFTQTNSGQGVARNLGVRHAKGEFLTFLDSDDTVPRTAYQHMVESLRASGSDFSVGGVRRMRHNEYIRHVWTRTVHSQDRIGITLEDFPNAMQDIIACNRMFKTSFWREKVGDFRGHIAYEDHVPMLTAYVRAKSFDILSEITYNWRLRENLTSTGQQKALLENLLDRIAVKEEANQLLLAEASDHVYDMWVGRTLEVDFPPFIAHAQSGNDIYRNVLSAVFETFNARATERAFDLVRVYQKVRGQLVAQARWDDLAESDRYFEQILQLPATYVENGTILADLPADAPFLAELPDYVRRLSPLECHFEGVLERIEWTADDVRLTGWAAHRGVGIGLGHADFTIWLADDAGRRIDLAVEPVRLPESNIWSRQLFADSDGGGFVAVVALSELAAAGEGSWHLNVEVRYAGITSAGTIHHRVLESGMVRPSARQVGLLLVSSRWDKVAGFSLDVTAAAVQVESLAIDEPARVASGVLRLPHGVRSPSLVLSAPDDRLVKVRLSGEGPIVAFTAAIPPLSGSTPESRVFELTAKANGGSVPILWPDTLAEPVGTRDDRSAAWVRSTTRGPVLVVGVPQLEIVSMTAVDDTVQLVVRRLGLSDEQVAGVELANARDSLELLEVSQHGELAQLTYSLLVSRFGGPPRLAASATYRLSVRLPHGQLVASAAPEYAGRLPERVYGDLLDLKLGQLREGPVQLSTLPPLRENEVGAVNERRMQDHYRAGLHTPTDSVLFQCYRGEFACDSQLALDRGLAEHRPELIRYWGVADRATEVPAGGVPLIIGSQEWYDALGSSRFVCNNIDFGDFFELQPHQRYLQTFHGYPFKSMGIGFWRSKGLNDEQVAKAVGRANHEWDTILVPSEATGQMYREQYAFPGEILVAGYPRSDFIVNADRDVVRSDVLGRLGVPPGKTVVLYAPTYRDTLTTRTYAAKRFDGLDLVKLACTLGEGYVVLLRGHNNNQRELDRVQDVAQVVDVTDWPDINELTVAADVAILDYSSLRFDWALTGKPMVFFVPDLDEYFALRAPLFPFEGTAPGPWADTTEQVAAELADLPSLRHRYAADIAAFNARFNALQDGHATERVIEAFFAPRREAGPREQ